MLPKKKYLLHYFPTIALRLGKLLNFINLSLADWYLWILFPRVKSITFSIELVKKSHSRPSGNQIEPIFILFYNGGFIEIGIREQGPYLLPTQ